MNSHLYIPAKKSVRIRPDFSSRPIKIYLPRDRQVAVFVMALVCIWGAIGTVGTFWPVAMMSEKLQGAQQLWSFALAFGITAVVLYFGWTALRLYVTNDTIIIEDKTVCFTRTQLLSQSSWCEPLSSYAGVQKSSFSTQLKNKTVTYQMVEIVHGETAKTLPVFVDRGTSLPAHILRELAGSLGLDVLQTD